MTETPAHLNPTRRHDFVLIFQVTDGNPNGDPDAANRPRTDDRTGHGRVSDASVKRKVRDYVHTLHADSDTHRIFIQRDEPLNGTLRKAYEVLGLTGSKAAERKLAPELLQAVTDLQEREVLPMAFTVDEDEGLLSYDTSLTKEDVKALFEQLKSQRLPKALMDALKDITKGSGQNKVNTENVGRAREYMLEKYYDVRMFGATMDTGTHKAGQVRGAMQVHMGRSAHPIETVHDSLARVTVTREEDRHKRTTFADRWTVPYAAYTVTGQYSPHSDAAGFVTSDDLQLFWEALTKMYDNHRTASSGSTSTLKVVIFTHEHPMGNLPSYVLYDDVTITATDTPRSVKDLQVQVPANGPHPRSPAVTVTVLDPANPS